MNSFEAMGQAQLHAAEGQRLLSAKLATSLAGLLTRAVAALGSRNPAKPLPR